MHFLSNKIILLKKNAVPSLDKFHGDEHDDFPGEITFAVGKIVINSGRKAVKIKVINRADRPIQVKWLESWFASLHNCSIACLNLSWMRLETTRLVVRCKYKVTTLVVIQSKVHTF